MFAMSHFCTQAYKHMNQPIEIPFSQAKRIIQAAYPGERGSRRKVKLELSASYHVQDYWDGGTRHVARFVNLAPIKTLGRSEVQAGPNEPSACNLDDYLVTLEPAYCVVEHTIFQGKEMGYRIILHPSHQSDWNYFIKAPK